MNHGVPVSDTVFGGPLPALYDAAMVPLIFAVYAEDLATRVAALQPARVLETAAGTGAVTRALAARLAPPVELVATDLNPPMLAHAQAVGTPRPVVWQVADAMRLPFGDGHFDVVACQFGAMFFPDKARAFAEARRVLRPGGRLLFSVWDAIGHNELADTVTQALAALHPADPPRFLARTPHGYHEVATVLRDLALGGFRTRPEVETVGARSRAPDAGHVAASFCLGTPLRGEIEARGMDLDEARIACAAAIAARFGDGPVDAGIRAHVFSVAA